eukprot:3630254-Rhodomonas_salina.1
MATEETTIKVSQPTHITHEAKAKAGVMVHRYNYWLACLDEQIWLTGDVIWAFLRRMGHHRQI